MVQCFGWTSRTIDGPAPHLPWPSVGAVAVGSRKAGPTPQISLPDEVAYGVLKSGEHLAVIRGSSCRKQTRASEHLQTNAHLLRARPPDSSERCEFFIEEILKAEQALHFLGCDGNEISFGPRHKMNRRSARLHRGAIEVKSER